MMIVDMLADPGRPDVIPFLLQDALEQGQRHGSESLTCCLPKGHRYERNLRESGFVAEVRMTGDEPMRMIWFPVAITILTRCHRHLLHVISCSGTRIGCRNNIYYQIS